MQVELINPFLTAASDVFRTMLNCELTRGALSLKSTNTPEYEVSGLIGLSGKCQGMVVFSLGRDTALRATEVMLGQRPDSLNADVVDTVGELANMIAGAAKARLEQYELSISLPSVICGKHHSISFPSNSKPIVLPFQSKIGPVCIEVGLADLEQKKPAKALASAATN
jgi:chemotaxis protein CheX